MAHGGKRKGSGRRKGAKTQRVQEIAEKATAEGVSPLEVMLGAMRQAWDASDKDAAARYAKDAAPYVHPRLAAVEHTGKDGKDLIPDDSPAALAKAIVDFIREAQITSKE